MNFIFWGSPKFSAIILEKLIEAGHIPSAVVCNPDKPVGRKKIITPPAVKERIMNYAMPAGRQELGIRDKIRIFQPEKLDSDFLNSLFLIHNSFDLFVVASYAKILRKIILEVPRLGTIGVHPSLLPKYRGTSPIQNQILSGDEIAGTTLYLMGEGMDDGPIINKSEIRMSKSETYVSLHDKLAELSANLLIETLPKFLSGEFKPQEQDHNQATFTKKFKTADGFITYEDLKKAENDGGEIAIEIDRKIRALNPEPGVFTLSPSKGGQYKRMKILEAELLPENKLKLKVIQYEGKNPVKI